MGQRRFGERSRGGVMDEAPGIRRCPMAGQSSIRIADHFHELTDPRRREPIYPLLNIVVMALCAVLCGSDDFVSIAKWANTKKGWLARFLDLRSGVPSHDRFNAIFAALKP